MDGLTLLVLVAFANPCHCSRTFEATQFYLRPVTRFSFGDSIVKEMIVQDRSNLTCGTLCIGNKNCTAFQVNGQDCLLLRRWSLATEIDMDIAEYVYETYTPEWSKLMIIGGKIDGSEIVTEVEVLDLKHAKRCPTLTSLPEGRIAARAFVSGSKLILVGGEGESEAFRDIIQYNYNTGTWDKINQMAKSVSDFPSAQIRDDWVLLLGGEGNFVGSDLLDATTILFSNGTMASGPNIPEPNKGACAIGLDKNRIFLAGGKTDAESYSTKVFILDWTTQAWTPQASLTFGRRYPECEVFTDRQDEQSVLVVAGNLDFGDKVEILSLKTMTWRLGPAFPNILFLPRIVSFDGLLYVIGGFDIASLTYWSNIHVFHPQNESWIEFPIKLNTAKRDFSVMKVPNELFPC